MNQTASRLPSGRTLIWLALLAGAVLLMLLVARPILFGGPAFHGTAYEPPAAAPPFTLTDQTGKSTRLEEFRGRPVLLFFGYTHCPDVCPLTLSALTRSLRALGDDAGDAQVLLVTVDPARDTPAVIRHYVEQFGPRVTGLTGDSAALQRVRAAYGVFAGGHGGAHATIGHTDGVFGIDRQGQIRVLIHPDAPPEHLKGDLRTLARL